MHLRKEEMILFPAIIAGGSVRNPIRVMESEHEGAGEALVKIPAIAAETA